MNVKGLVWGWVFLVSGAFVWGWLCYPTSRPLMGAWLFLGVATGLWVLEKHAYERDGVPW